jgi:hypothetical protein
MTMFHTIVASFIILLGTSILGDQGPGVSSYTSSSTNTITRRCSPAYSPGSAYTIGNLVSQSITTTIPLASTPCTVRGAGCHTGWTQTGDVANTATYNFVCSLPKWCSNVDYAPGSINSDLAWTKEAVACSVSTSVCL